MEGKKEYVLPEVKPEDVTPERLEEIFEAITKHPPETPQLPYEPIASKRLEKDLLQPLWQFVRGCSDACLSSQALKWLGDSARIIHNRHLIGGLFRPIPLLLQCTKENMHKSDPNRFSTAKMALRLMANLCFDNPYLREKFTEAGGVPVLCEFLQHSDYEFQRLACGLCANACSGTPDICIELYRLGGSKSLLDLIKSPNDNVQCMAARALRNTCETEEIRMNYVVNGVLEYAIHILQVTEDDDSMVAEFVGVINGMTSTKTVLYDFLNKYNGLNTLVDILIKAHAVQLIADVTDLVTSWAESPELQPIFLRSGVIQKIGAIFLDPNAPCRIEVRVSMGKVYSSLASYDPVTKDIYMNLDRIIKLLDDEEKEIQVVAAMTIANLARSEEYCSDMVSRGLPLLLISTTRDENKDLRVRHYACATLRNISISDRNKPILLKMGIMDPVVKLLTLRDNHIVMHTAVGVIKSLLLGGSEYAGAFFDAGGLPLITELVHFKESDHVRYESCRVIAALLKNASLHDVVCANGGRALSALVTLMMAKFDVLKTEGTLACRALLSNGFLSLVKEIPQIATGLLCVLAPKKTHESKPDTQKSAVQPLQFSTPLDVIGF
eukprot:TRINITY_DN1157_c0_g2_i13.p1 TRINITY_DN1157_c0_g2~~TRINITY_DN1157_c0_g2_i13.p1  ORF type:complete len:609 (+),score=97.22 TRINITY_DN1157_c0_g2_i13:73-1899(+)